eukprot:6939874-Karenia_brevis.AAC.1
MKHHSFADGKPCNVSWRGRDGAVIKNHGIMERIMEFFDILKTAYLYYAQHEICLVDCRKYRDPAEDRALRNHCGSHPEILSNVSAHDDCRSLQ